MAINRICRYWDDIQPGEAIPRVTMAVPYEKVILDTAATNDYFPGHHNPEYAKNQGQRQIYLNTMAIEGFIDRVATGWCGPHAFIKKRSIQMRASIYAGDAMHGEGRVERRYTNEQGQPLVDISIAVSTDAGLCVPATLTLVVPCRIG